MFSQQENEDRSSCSWIVEEQHLVFARVFLSASLVLSLSVILFHKMNIDAHAMYTMASFAAACSPPEEI